MNVFENIITKAASGVNRMLVDQHAFLIDLLGLICSEAVV